MVHSESLSLFGDCKYFRTSWIDKSPPQKKRCMGLRPAGEKGRCKYKPSKQKQLQSPQSASSGAEPRAPLWGRSHLMDGLCCWLCVTSWPPFNPSQLQWHKHARPRTGGRACVWTVVRHKHTPDNIRHKHGDVWGNRHSACRDVTAFSYRRTAKTWKRDPFPAQTTAPVGRTLAKGRCWLVTLFCSLCLLLWLDQSSSLLAHLQLTWVWFEPSFMVSSHVTTPINMNLLKLCLRWRPNPLWGL